MAVKSVEVMVLSDLPFLTAAADSDEIEDTRVEYTYLMQSQTGKEDGDVEAEVNYNNLENMMFAAMVKFNMAKRQVTKNMEGDAQASPAVAPGTGTKRLKKGSADIVDAEFEGIKASDGARLQMLTKEWFGACMQEICAISSELNYSNPLCIRSKDEYILTHPFIIGEDFPPNQPDPYNNLFDRPIGGG